MIRIVCPGCQSELNAKDELVGQTRKCPKCSEPVLITEPESSPGSSTESLVRLPDADQGGEMTLRSVDAPKRLEPASRYLILDNTRLVAAWKSDGKGWMLKTGAGLISAKRNHDELPARGNFKLVELELVRGQQGLRLTAITSYELATSWALTCLDRGDNQILAKVTAPGSLNKDQKNVIRLLIRDELMHEVWQDARNVLDYLGDTDYHSPGTA